MNVWSLELSLHPPPLPPSQLTAPLPSLTQLREDCRRRVAEMRSDHLRHLNPTPYKVSLSESLYTYMHDLWLHHLPVGELS